MALGSGDVDSRGHHARWEEEGSKRGGKGREGELEVGVGWQGRREQGRREIDRRHEFGFEDFHFLDWGWSPSIEASSHPTEEVGIEDKLLRLLGSGVAEELRKRRSLSSLCLSFRSRRKSDPYLGEEEGKTKEVDLI